MKPASFAMMIYQIINEKVIKSHCFEVTLGLIEVLYSHVDAWINGDSSLPLSTNDPGNKASLC